MSDEDHVEPELDESKDELDGEAKDLVSRGDSASALANKETERKRIQEDIEAFLARGGKIDSIDSHVVADPPKKPESSYGSQPI